MEALPVGVVAVDPLIARALKSAKVRFPVVAALILYSIVQNTNQLPLVKPLPLSRNSRSDHARFAMCSLGAEVPNWCCRCDFQSPSWQRGSVLGDGDKARVETDGVGGRVLKESARVREGRLSDGVILGLEDERDGVANHCRDVFWSEDQSSCAADDNLMVGGLGEREEGSEDGEEEHDWDVE